MTINQNLEYNILGCTVRIKSDGENNNKAVQAVDLLNNEIENLRRANPKLKDTDVAVLSALNIATKFIDKDDEYKENVFALKAGIEDALNFVEEVSPGSMQTN